MIRLTNWHNLVLVGFITYRSGDQLFMSEAFWISRRVQGALEGPDQFHHFYIAPFFLLAVFRSSMAFSNFYF